MARSNEVEDIPKTDIKALFSALLAGKTDQAGRLLDELPALAYAVAPSTPKRDAGQSTLQVALQTGHYEIANALLKMGASIDFQEAKGRNRWTMRSAPRCVAPQ